MCAVNGIGGGVGEQEVYVGEAADDGSEAGAQLGLGADGDARARTDLEAFDGEDVELYVEIGRPWRAV